MEKKEIPEACKICIALSGGDKANPYYSEDGSEFYPCDYTPYNAGSACLPKDRAMIVLLHELLLDSRQNSAMFVLIQRSLQALG